MTECERLITNGSIEPTFLQEEVRNNYVISSNMKKVWAVELDLLKKFIELCEKYQLTYWVGFGTLLGAVRHHGFIPWDDDMDVWMPRADYERLLQLTPDVIGEPYFLQTTMND